MTSRCEIGTWFSHCFLGQISVLDSTEFLKSVAEFLPSIMRSSHVVGDLHITPMVCLKLF